MLHQLDCKRKRSYNIDMRIILTTLLIFLSTTCFAVQPNWRMSPVQGKDQLAGYIYHTSAVGRQSDVTKKIFTSLRLICSLKGGAPIVALYWNSGLYTNEDVIVSITAEGKEVGQPATWTNDNGLLYRNIADSSELMEALGTGKIIKFQWVTNDTTQYMTAFSVSGIDLADFNTKCKIR